MAEALQLGVNVIATDFGGNTDFCTVPLAHPVHWRKAPIPRGSYPLADGHSWAEPDLDHAVELCQQVATKREEIAANPIAKYSINDSAVLCEYRKQFPFVEVGSRYRSRLQALCSTFNIIIDK